MITLITGAPGSGKTNALVSLLHDVFVQQKEDDKPPRTIYVSGIPDLSFPHVELDDPTKWHETVEEGAVVVIDEVQRIWRPNRSKVTEDIAALETHRHTGTDFFIVTQHPGLVHSNVRGLVGRHIHIRDTGPVTGRWWYEWPEVCSNVNSGWKTAPIKKHYRLDKKAQKLYKSSSLHVKPVRSLPPSIIFLSVVLVLLAFMGYRVYNQMKPKLDLAASMGQPHQSSASAPVAAPAGGPDLSAPPAALTASEPTSAGGTAPRPRLAGCVLMRDRCECLDSDGYVMTVDLQMCRLNAARTGADLPYASRDSAPSPALAELLRRTPDISESRGSQN